MTDEFSGGIRGAVHKTSGRVILWGVIVILAGVWCLLSPFITAKSVTILVGIGIAIAGASALASVSREQGVVHKLLDILLGVFSLFAGLFITFNPTAGALSVGDRSHGPAIRAGPDGACGRFSGYGRQELDLFGGGDRHRPRLPALSSGTGRRRRHGRPLRRTEHHHLGRPDDHCGARGSVAGYHDLNRIKSGPSSGSKAPTCPKRRQAPRPWSRRRSAPRCRGSAGRSFPWEFRTDKAPLGLLVKLLADQAERLGRGDDHQLRRNYS